VLACIGIYGVLATTVVQQTRDIGVRMALGARRGDVLKMIMGQGLRWVAIGLGIGLLFGFLLTRMLASLLFGVGPTNPLTYIAVSAVMLSVAALACYLPAVRATRIDPMRALRYE
jgi:putative ABC transport system permease protein